LKTPSGPKPPATSAEPPREPGPTSTGGLDAAIGPGPAPATAADYTTAEAAESLKAELERIMPRDAPVADWTTQNAVDVIGALRDFVGDVMNTPDGHIDGLRVVVLHPVTELLGSLSAALGELKSGLADARLRPAAPEEGAKTENARLKAAQKEQIASWLGMVTVARSTKNLTWDAAEALIERELRHQGVRYKDDPVSSDMLKQWRKDRPRRILNRGK
jgi:hypothetical protein